MLELAELQAEAPSLGLQLRPVSVPTADGALGLLQAMPGSPPDALIVIGSPVTRSTLHVIPSYASAHRVPAIYPSREFAGHGGLLAYGPYRKDLQRLAAVDADKILRGARPGDLPVQTPTQLDLMVNLKAARAGGLTVPAAVLARATDVVQ